jgi:hypothetical protein
LIELLRQDLAVKIEGTFILRYRMFDIFSKVSGIDDLLIQAECYGGPFRVYSTKEFPGLQASTELTKVSCQLEPFFSPARLIVLFRPSIFVLSPQP